MYLDLPVNQKLNKFAIIWDEIETVEIFNNTSRYIHIPVKIVGGWVCISVNIYL